MVRRLLAAGVALLTIVPMVAGLLIGFPLAYLWFCDAYKVNDWFENCCSAYGRMLRRVGGQESPNDPKLSDGRGWRDRCVAGERRRQEAAGVTAAPVRCSAWLGVDVRFGVGPEVCGTVRIKAQRRVARKPKLVAEQAVE